MKNKPKQPEETAWEKGFDGHADAQLLRLSKLSFEEKLKWLDEVNRFVFKIQSPDSSTSQK